MIPKIIHYCWFGRKQYPEKIEFCISTWKKLLPDYEFILWDEDNFDINISVFTKQAYETRKYAFVSDYARVYALANFGGIYLDTDIEVKKDFDDILNHKVVLGTDESGYLTAFMASEKRHCYFQNLLEVYNSISFLREDGSADMTVNNTWMQDELSKFGYEIKNKYQELSHDIVVYPDDYFHARSLISGEMNITNNTYCIHHHTVLWVPLKTRIIRFLRMNIVVPIIGAQKYSKVVSFVKRITRN